MPARNARKARPQILYNEDIIRLCGLQSNLFCLVYARMMSFRFDVALWAMISYVPYSWPLWQGYASKFVATSMVSIWQSFMGVLIILVKVFYWLGQDTDDLQRRRLNCENSFRFRLILFGVMQEDRGHSICLAIGCVMNLKRLERVWNLRRDKILHLVTILAIYAHKKVWYKRSLPRRKYQLFWIVSRVCEPDTLLAALELIAP